MASDLAILHVTWWKHAVIYQIYPRSFQDTNGDGIGDLRGVVRRLDYLVDLGVDALWLSPFYRSPMRDFGYDVRDHVSIDPIFGDMADFRDLVLGCRARGLKLIVDFIPNHVSDEHLWFRESRSSRTNPRRDWFVWRDPGEDGGPPNNWRSEFGGRAWTFDEARGQYYYHAFLSSQPDLNWRNADVVEAMCNVMRFWLDRGVDGFRVDAIHHLIEHPDAPDNPVNPAWREGMDPADRLLKVYTVDQPEVHAAVAAMRRALAEYPGERVLIGEAYLPIERLVTYYGAAGEGFDLPFNFHMMSTPWTPTAIAALIGAYERSLPDHGWPNWVLSNHDRSRLASRIRAIAYQQLTAKAGDAMVERLKGLAGGQFPRPQEILDLEPDALRGCGFSGAKSGTITAIAQAAISGLVPSRDLADKIKDEVLIERLTSIKGIGRWTVEMLLMYSLERMDVLPVDDFGVREGYRVLKALDTQPKPKALADLAKAWAPHRTVASWYLWRIPRERGNALN
ncbi:hypothetical protein BH10PSE4_BH10PSE4_32080 [soil metagenome]